MTRARLLAAALLAVACSGPPPQRSTARPDGTYVPATGLSPRDEARVALEEDARRREARFLEALQPGRGLASTALTSEELAAGLVPPGALSALGAQLFHARFPGPVARVQGSGAPDAQRCASCHRRGGRAGSGDAVDLAYVDGDGVRVSSALHRRPPPLLGLAAVELLAGEMSGDLARLRDAARATARRAGANAIAELETHGVSFGRLVVTPAGALDVSGVTGVDADLVVRPFGATGRHARLRDAVEEELTRHVAASLSPEQVTAITAFLALGAVPVREAPLDPELALASAAGEVRFAALGCAGCHVPSLPLGGTRVSLAAGVELDLARDGEPPRLAPDAADGVVRAWLYSDLRRHDLGPGLADPRPERGEAAGTFVTRPLWGLATSAPYLHDGRAPTVEDAILAHGGEAQAARDAYAALGYRERGELRVFLATLTRARRLEVP